MPLYEYQCQQCGKVFEKIQKFADDPLTVHPDCGGAVERLVSAPSFQFKGSGWYVTDYAKSGSGGKGEKSESKADSKSESKTESKSESKSETKSDSGSSSSKPSTSSSSS